jgi:hypothetical protein
MTDGDPCAFCALMASRGPSYTDKGTAGGSANAKFIGEGLFKFHNDCGCTVAPSFQRGTKHLSPIAQEAARVYSKETDAPTLAAFRKAWNNRSR